jgi:integrase
MPLTQTAISKANKRRKYADGRGLFLSVSANKRKTWVFCYRFPDPAAKRGYREREMGLGSIEHMDLEEARREVMRLRGQVQEGIDPLEERRSGSPVAMRRQPGRTFREVAERLIEKKRPGWTKNGRSEEAWAGSLENHAYPIIGNKDVADITMFDVRDVLMKIWTTNNVMASRLQNRIHAVMTLAAVEQLRPDENPADRQKLLLMLPEHVHEEEPQAAMPYVELPGFITELRKEEGIAPRALEFTILTAARTGDTIGAVWDEIDLDAREWVIPASRMKGKKSRKKLPDHRIPLSDRLVHILEHLPREEGNPFVFISKTNKDKGLSNMAMLKLLKNDMKRPDATVHGFRSAFRDWAAEETDHPDYVAEKALAHAIKSHVEAAYRRGDLFDKRRDLMNDWTAYCEGRLPLRTEALRDAA